MTEHPGTPESEVIKKDVKIDDTASTKDGSKKEEKTGREKEGKSKCRGIGWGKSERGEMKLLVRGTGVGRNGKERRVLANED